MAGGKSTAYRNNFLNWALNVGGASPTRPTSLQIALYTDSTGLAANSTGPSTEATTTTFPGYARQTATFGTSASGGSISNTVASTFTATGAGTTPINYYGIIDNSGSMIYWAPLSTPRTPGANGDKIDFAIGAIVVNES